MERPEKFGANHDRFDRGRCEGESCGSQRELDK